MGKFQRLSALLILSLLSILCLSMMLQRLHNYHVEPDDLELHWRNIVGSRWVPVDHTPQPFLISPTWLCSGKIFTLFVVHSAVNHRKRRNLIRSTWGSVHRINKDRIAVVFVIGQTEDSILNESITRESDAHGDLLQADFIDTYKNLTYKHLYWIKWVAQNCRGVKYIVKADDDVIVNVFRVHRALTEEMSDKNNFIRCWVNLDPPQRVTGERWRVTKSEWPSNTYPTYCYGPAYITSKNVILKLHENAGWTKTFWIEDVFVTGVLATFAKVPRMSFGDNWSNVDMSQKPSGPQVDNIAIVTQLSNEVVKDKYVKVWKDMVRYSAGKYKLA